MISIQHFAVRAASKEFGRHLISSKEPDADDSASSIRAGRVAGSRRRSHCQRLGR